MGGAFTTATTEACKPRAAGTPEVIVPLFGGQMALEQAWRLDILRAHPPTDVAEVGMQREAVPPALVTPPSQVLLGSPQRGHGHHVKHCLLNGH